MANPLYRTHYKNDYKWIEVPRTPLWKPVDCFEPSLDKQQYLSPREEQKAWEEEHERMIKKLHKSRMRSTYQRDFCKQYCTVGEKEDSEEVVDVFLQELEQYYSDPSRKVVPPLATTRRVFAYGRPAFFRTGMSEYKDRICRQAYNIFKRDKDAGIVRLGRMKRASKVPVSSSQANSPTISNPVSWGQPANYSKIESGGCACGLDFCPCK